MPEASQVYNERYPHTYANPGGVEEEREKKRDKKWYKVPEALKNSGTFKNEHNITIIE